MKRKKRSSFIKRVPRLGLAAVITFVAVLIFAMAGDVIFKAGEFNISGDTIVGSNLNVAGQINATGNINTTGNVSANYFIGNGSSLTDIIPSGVIVMWSGTIATIPSGWALCNGSAGTPDLRDKFIIGAGNSYSPGDTGGSTTITDANLPSHTHAAGTLAGPSHTHTGPSHTHGKGNLATASDGAHTHTIVERAGSGATDSVNIDIKSTTPYDTYVVPSAGAHTHTITGSTAAGGTGNTGASGTGAVTGSTEATGSGTAYLQPYYALAYIMKL